MQYDAQPQNFQNQQFQPQEGNGNFAPPQNFDNGNGFNPNMMNMPNMDMNFMGMQQGGNFGGNFNNPNQGFNNNNENFNARYKTALCNNFVQTGSCKFGDSCRFAHGDQELRNSPMERGGGMGGRGGGRGAPRGGSRGGYGGGGRGGGGYGGGGGRGGYGAQGGQRGGGRGGYGGQRGGGGYGGGGYGGQRGGGGYGGRGGRGGYGNQMGGDMMNQMQGQMMGGNMMGDMGGYGGFGGDMGMGGMGGMQNMDGQGHDESQGQGSDSGTPGQNPNQQMMGGPPQNGGVCKFFMQSGECKFGENCRFSHQNTN